MIAWWLRFVLLAQIVAATALAVWMQGRWGPLLSSPGAAAMGVMLVVLIHPLMICGQFVIARLYKSPPPPEHQLGVWRALQTLDAELDASVRTFCWAQPFFASRPSPPAQTSSIAPAQPRAALLFVHGFFCNRAIWLPTMRAAAARGHVCEAVSLEPPTVDIDQYNAQLNIAIDQLHTKAPNSPLIIVGHSMGGLVARAWLRDNARRTSEIAHLVTLGTPHHGTVHARFVLAPNGQQMRPNNMWLVALAAGETTEDRARITSLYSYHDNVVAPQLSGHLEHAHNIAVSGVGHVSLVYDQQVRQILFDEIDRVTPATPQALPAGLSPSEDLAPNS